MDEMDERLVLRLTASKAEVYILRWRGGSKARNNLRHYPSNNQAGYIISFSGPDKRRMQRLLFCFGIHPCLCRHWAQLPSSSSGLSP